MRNEKFKSLVGGVHEEWASLSLGVPRGGHDGPDLIDFGKFLEVKFHLLGHSGKAPEYLSWTAQEHQVMYPRDSQFDGLTPYWALGSYRMSKAVDDIAEDEGKDAIVESIVERNLWVVPWEWAMQFDMHRTRYYNMRYLIPFPKRGGKEPLPRTYKTCNVDGGKIMLTAGVRRNDFRCLG